MTAEIKALFLKNLPALAGSLDEATRSVLPEYERLQQAGEKGELAHIYVSFLRSGVICRQPWLRLNLYDEKGLEDIVECGAKWDVPFISDRLYSDADLWKKQRGHTYDYELEQYRRELMEEYFQVFDQFFPEIINKCAITHALNCEWHFGEFMGNSTMDYFKLGQDRRIPYAVTLNGVQYIKGFREYRQGDMSALDKIVVSSVNPSSVNFYPDILDRQIFMIKDSVKDVFDMFLPEIKYKHCGLIDKALEQQYTLYYIPILDVMDLREGIEKEHRYIFRIAGTEEIEVAATLEVVEAVLRRNPAGVMISPIS